MKTGYETKHLKLNTELRGLPAGHVQRICCIDGVPTERYWRRRLKDSEIDNCVEVVAPKSKAATLKNTKEKSEG